MSNPNEDSLHASNPNHNVNPTYLYNFNTDFKTYYIVSSNQIINIINK